MALQHRHQKTGASVAGRIVRALALGLLLAICTSVLIAVGLYLRAILTLDAMLQP